MYTLIKGFDYTSYVPHDSITFSGSIGDPQPTGSLEVDDQGSTLSFIIGDEVILWDDNAPPSRVISGQSFPTVPAHNLVPFSSASPPWSLNSSPLSGLFSGFPGQSPSMTFSNTTYSGGNNYGLATAQTSVGYIHPGQSYIFSMYLTISTPLHNASYIVKIDFVDNQNNIIGGSSVTATGSSTTGNTTQRISVQNVAPVGAVTMYASFGGSANVSGNNSGTITFATPQLEPMWFTAQGITYPTSDCNVNQGTCAQMPDNTISRACRLFSGYIQDYTITYDGPNRIWTLNLASSGSILENGLVNGAFEGQHDDDIISSVISTYFTGLLSISQPNAFAAFPVLRGALIDAVSYNDNTLREVMNGLSDASGYMYYVDPYYTLNYNPSFYAAAPFTLTGGTPDNVSSFNYYDYQLEEDGSQRKRNVKVTGGNFIAPAITDTFSANGSTSTFSLSQQPYNVISVISNSNGQKSFFSGSGPTLGSGGYTCRIDKTAQTMTFSFNPASGTNNVSITYTYEAPVCVLVRDQDTTNQPVAPAYAIPNYDSKVNDSNIQSIPAAIQRGLAELSKFSDPQIILTLKSSQYAAAGLTLFLTSTLDGIINQPYTVQKVDGSYLGNGINEYSYTLGAYRPTVLDHLRNANKSVNRSMTTANTNTPQQTDLVFGEHMQYSESATFTLQTLSTSTYGTGIYGANKYA